MIRLIFQNIVYPSVTLSEIRIELGTGDVTATYYPRLIRLGEFVIGNDDPEDEAIMFPGHLSIDFLFPVAENVVNGICQPSVSASFLEYFNTLEHLQLYGASIFIYKKGETSPFYIAFFNKEDNGLVKGSNPERRISIVFLDDYTRLTEEPDVNNQGSFPVFPGGGNYETVVRLGELVKHLFGSTARRSTNNPISSVQFLTKFRFKKYLTINLDTFEYVYLTNDELGCRNWHFYTDDTPTRADQFKRLLTSLASYAVIDFNRTVKILPLWYDGTPVKTIMRSSIESEDEVEYGRKWDGMIASSAHSGSDDGGKSFGLQWTQKNYGYFYYRTDHTGRRTGTTYLVNEKDIVKKEFLFSVGSNDVTSDGRAKMLKFISRVDGTSVSVKAGAVSYMNAEGSWSAEMSLSDWAASLTWESLSNKARKFRVTLPGIDYKFGDYFRVEGIDATFRPVLIAYDYEEDKTRIVIRENTNYGSFINPTSVSFSKILRAFDYSVTIRKRNGNTTFNYTGGDQLSTLPEAPFMSNEELVVKIKNAYNCLRKSAVEYDGIQLALNNTDLKLWIDNWQYVIYIAIGKSKDTVAPASLYPVADDANVNWYKLTSINDLKQDDPEYEYESVYTVKNIHTKNPFWIWAGLKSSKAQLFPGIGVYNK